MKTLNKLLTTRREGDLDSLLPKREEHLPDILVYDVEHGRFDGQLHEKSPQLWATKNRGWLAAAGLGLAGLAVTALRK